MNERIFKHHDLPKNHLASAPRLHYVPSRSLDPEVIDARRALPKGTLIHAHEVGGTMVAARFLGKLKRLDDLREGSRLVAAAAFNTAWYTHARDASTMRRRLWLPQQVNPDTDERMSDFDRSLDAAEQLVAGLITGNRVLSEHIRRGRATARSRARFGVVMGDAALSIAVAPHIGLAASGTHASVQRRVRDIAMQTAYDAQTMHGTFGTHPSMAQFGDADSDVSRSVRLHA
ncbi:hypothetical protein KDA14_02505, partial [Candidatus Saccharibacteria bacterium]|nr:hypothetical protein [Candidatus Saccharibacteria bacterium]